MERRKIYLFSSFVPFEVFEFLRLTRVVVERRALGTLVHASWRQAPLSFREKKPYRIFVGLSWNLLFSLSAARSLLGRPDSSLGGLCTRGAGSYLTLGTDTQ